MKLRIFCTPMHRGKYYNVYFKDTVDQVRTLSRRVFKGPTPHNAGGFTITFPRPRGRCMGYMVLAHSLLKKEGICYASHEVTHAAFAHTLGVVRRRKTFDSDEMLATTQGIMLEQLVCRYERASGKLISLGTWLSKWRRRAQ